MSEPNTILVTGGAGYIGSHVIQKLIQSGYSPVILDNLCSSDLSNLEALERHFPCLLPFYQGDIANSELLTRIFTEHQVKAVMHFAALKDVNQSFLNPHQYYRANVEGTLRLIEAMDKAAVRKLIFSSSASVYGLPKTNPVAENTAFSLATSPYGATKQAVESILATHCVANPAWSCGTLRYFNPVGANSDIGLSERATNAATNLFPIIIESIQKGIPVNIFGTNLPTPDGSGVRDYIHVDDLAAGHMAALDYIAARSGYHTWNLGTGRGHSVLEVIQAFSEYLGYPVEFSACAPRPGDAPECWASTAKARNELDWVAKLNLKDMIRSAWAARQP